MREMKNFSFSINVSAEAYETKVEAWKCLSRDGAKELGREKMAFWGRHITVDDFLGYATSGHTFCALFDYDPNQKYWIENRLGKKEKISPVYKRGKNKGAMNIKMKRDQFFLGAQAIFVDVDYTRFANVKDYIDALKYKPTCVYMSYSDRQEKEGKISRRFRLVYVFDKILDTNEFIHVSSAITQQIEQDTNEKMEDTCGERRSQYMNGVYGIKKTYKTYFIYSVTDFPMLPPQPAAIQPVIPVAASPPKIGFTESFVYDMEHLPYETFMHYHSWMGRLTTIDRKSAQNAFFLGLLVLAVRSDRAEGHSRTKEREGNEMRIDLTETTTADIDRSDSVNEIVHRVDIGRRVRPHRH